jgi:hypothetical protein
MRDVHDATRTSLGARWVAVLGIKRGGNRMNAVVTTIYRYLAMWNETDAAPRAEHIERASADDEYVDPVVAAEGHAGLSETVADVRAQYPGHRLRQEEAISSPHAHFAWELVAPDGTVAVAGIDVGALAPEGRLKHVVGFFGPLPWESATTGSFATGQARDVARGWSKGQMVAAGLRRGMP